MSNFAVNFDYLTLKAFLDENAGFLTGARIQKIQQPTRQELIFGLRNQGESRRLYVNISPKFFHVCFISAENEQKRLIQIPKSPPMFCMQLRKYLEGAKISKVDQPKNEQILERILEFYFETYNELSEKIYLCLAIELMGKHSNVVLYNYDTNVIIGCAHNIGAEKSREREMAGGLPYTYPPKNNIRKEFLGLSSILETDVSQKISVTETIDNHFANLQEKEKIRQLKSKLSAVVRAKLKKINSSLDKIQKQSTSADKADLYRKKGDLIMANLFNHKDFSTSIDVTDYETNSPLKIALDKTKTLKENANNFYKLYTKAKATDVKSSQIIDELNREREYFEQISYSIESAQSVTDFLEINEELTKDEKITISKDRAKTEKKQNIISPLVIQHAPFIIYVGKNNKQNDYIVSKLARDEDLWFHVHNCAGSHVLLRIESGQSVNDEMIFECAKLAKQYSSAKDSSKVGVIYTKAKNLKKPTGANLGYVIYKGEKEIIVD